MPNALADEAGQPIINVGKVDVTANQNLGTRFEIKGFPTIKLLKDGKQFTFKGKRDVATIKAWALGGYATQEAEEIRAPLGIFGEIKYAFKELFELAKVDIQAGKYFTQHTIIMALPVIFTLMLFVILFLPDPAPSAEEIERLAKGKIAAWNDVLPYNPASTGALTVKYGNAVVSEGATLTPTASVAAPSVSFNSEQGDLYTLIMTDPDAPSRSEPSYREFIHWVVVNIKAGDISKGDTVASYVGPAPPHNSGKHRYVFLLFKQSASIDAAAATDHFKRRGGLRAHNWAKVNNLGLAVDAKVFESEWDASVDELHAKLNFVPPAQYLSPLQQKAAAEVPKETNVSNDSKSSDGARQRKTGGDAK